MSTLSKDELAAAIKATRAKAASAEGGERARAWRWGDGDEADGLELVGVVKEIELNVPGEYRERTVARITLAESGETVSLYIDQTVLARLWAEEEPAVGDTVVIARSPEKVTGGARSYWNFALTVIRAAGDGALGAARSALNVGAGAGAYEPAGRDVVAVEPSSLLIAQRPPGDSGRRDTRSRNRSGWRTAG
jgi:hypothetical protein